MARTKLRSLPPRLRTLRPSVLRIGYQGQTREERERERDTRRRAEQPWRAWYHLEIWNHPQTGLRAQQLERQPICQTCHQARATVAHHKIPHRGVWALFADPFNLESACKTCHDGAIQRGERAGNYGHQIELDRSVVVSANVLYPKDLPRSAIPLTLVCGAPGSGKTSYVEAHRKPGDIVIDIDAIIAELAGTWLRSNEVQSTYLETAMIERNRRLFALAHERVAGAAWFIVAAPAGSERERWAGALGAARVIVMETPTDVCVARIYRDANRAPIAAELACAAEAWWSRYSPGHCDEAR